MKVEIYKCFIASPGDTSEERSICDKVFEEINKTLGQQLHFRIESKKWEENARPSFGEDGQAVINEQLLDNYQMFIGIMWNRFGTETKRAQSGTEEEFNLAYDKRIEKDDLEIMMYFNTAPAEVGSLDLVQVQKVRDFKGKVSELGGLYWEYSGYEKFEMELKRHLNDYFVNKLNPITSSSNIKSKSDKPEEIALNNSVSLILNNKFKEALSLFSNQPVIWIDPVLSKTNKISNNADDNFDSKVNLKSIIDKPESIIIKSPPQFGLTCLANYMVNEAWSNGSLWVYLDARTAKKDVIKKSVEKCINELNLKGREISCIVLDSWISTENGAKKILRNLCHEYKDIPIIVMQTIDDSIFKNGDADVKINRDFNTLHLLALPRNQIRKVVCNYNDMKNIGDDSIILEKVIKDLDALNIHRTPLNCITLLKVSENNFDESPVNRTKMIEMVLFVLFNLDDLPTYKVKPDLKDCEYILGRFCEKLIRARSHRFSRENFLNDLDSFCKEKLLSLEVSVVFDVLYSNHIIMAMESEFVFRSSYWIYYFAARRMYSNKDFRDYILYEQSYVSFPEIIEFYTGIDRDRADILEILRNDLEAICNTVDDKTGLPDDFNPLSVAEWNPTEESLSQMHDVINDDILNSKLPESLKDKHADRGYNQLRPYDQSVQSILQEYSLTILIQKVKACSRALRNSDYVDTEIKRSLLKEITRGWKQISKILFALAPLLALKGQAAFDGYNFILVGDVDELSVEEKINSIFFSNPINVVDMFRHDLYSNKIGPLLFDGIKSETDDLIKHQLILLLISERPLEWKVQLEKYIADAPKNSYYLYDTVEHLSTTYEYAFASDTELNEIKYLLKMGFAKHEFGGKPNLATMKKISNEVIPKRND